MSGVEAVRGARRISHHNNCFDVWNVVNRNSKSRSPKQQTTCVWIMIHDHELMWHHPIRQVHPSSHQAFILRSPVPHSHLSLRPLEHRSDHNEIEMETSWLRSKPPEWCDKNQRPDIFDVRSFSFCRDMLWIHKERLWISLHIYIYISYHENLGGIWNSLCPIMRFLLGYSPNFNLHTFHCWGVEPRRCRIKPVAHQTVHGLPSGCAYSGATNIHLWILFHTEFTEG